MNFIKIDELNVTFIFEKDQANTCNLLKSLCAGRNVSYLMGNTKAGETTVTVPRSMYEIVLSAVDEATVTAGMLSRMLR